MTGAAEGAGEEEVGGGRRTGVKPSEEGGGFWHGKNCGSHTNNNNKRTDVHALKINSNCSMN